MAAIYGEGKYNKWCQVALRAIRTHLSEQARNLPETESVSVQEPMDLDAALESLEVVGDF